MKTMFNTIMFAIFFIASNNAKVNAQASWGIFPTGNNSVAGRFLGWSGVGLSQPLNIRNAFAQPILFQTAGAQRMTIRGQAGTTRGFVGIGTNFLTPQSLLHLHTPAPPLPPNGNPSTYLQITNGTTGTAATDGFKIGTTDNGAELRQQENLAMRFFTNDAQRATILANGNVGINKTNPVARLDVIQSHLTPVSGSSTAISAINNDLLILNSSAAVYGENTVSDINARSHTGGSFIASGAQSTFADLNKGLNVGVVGESGNDFDNTANFGGRFFVAVPLANYNFTNSLNIGIYARNNFDCPTCPVSPDFNAGNYAGWFDGDVVINAPNTVGTGFVFPSDSIFKTGIGSIADAEDIISQLQPRSFYFNTANVYGMKFSGKKQYGLIAQEVEPVLPELVGTAKKFATFDTDGNPLTQGLTYKTLNYNAFFALLIKGHQEQQATIETQNVKINNLESRLSALENSSNNDGSGSFKTAPNNQSSINNNQLQQNVPNPFSEKTRIDYALNEESNVELNVYSLDGRLVSTLMKGQQAAGNYSVDCCPNGNLPSGEYIYVLTVNGQQLQKKAVKIK